MPGSVAQALKSIHPGSVFLRLSRGYVFSLANVRSKGNAVSRAYENLTFLYLDRDVIAVRFISKGGTKVAQRNE